MEINLLKKKLIHGVAYALPAIETLSKENPCRVGKREPLLMSLQHRQNKAKNYIMSTWEKRATNYVTPT